MQEYMISFRGYSYIWAETPEEAEKIYRKRFAKKSAGKSTLEHCRAEPWQEDKEERLWK